RHRRSDDARGGSGDQPRAVRSVLSSLAQGVFVRPVRSTSATMRDAVIWALGGSLGLSVVPAGAVPPGTVSPGTASSRAPCCAVRGGLELRGGPPKAPAPPRAAPTPAPAPAKPAARPSPEAVSPPPQSDAAVDAAVDKPRDDAATAPMGAPVSPDAKHVLEEI